MGTELGLYANYTGFTCGNKYFKYSQFFWVFVVVYFLRAIVVAGNSTRSTIIVRWRRSYLLVVDDDGAYNWISYRMALFL